MISQLKYLPEASSSNTVTVEVEESEHCEEHNQSWVKNKHLIVSGVLSVLLITLKRIDVNSGNTQKKNQNGRNSMCQYKHLIFLL